MNHIIHNEVSTTKIVGFKPFQGLVVGVGEIWSVMKYITSDYIVDGYRFINNRYFYDNYLDKYDGMADSILKLRNIKFNEEIHYNLDDYEDLFISFAKENKMIQFFLAKNDVSYIGFVEKVYAKSCQIRLISTQAQLLSRYSFNYKSIRIVSIENNYLNSLSLIIKK